MSRFFVFRNLKDWKSGDYPVNASVSIGVADHLVLSTGEVLVSAALMTEREVDFAIDGLIKELEQVRRTAKANISADNSRVKADVANCLKTDGQE